MTVEKGIPVPVGSTCKHPWPQMEVGDSVFVKNGRHGVASAAQQWGQRHGRTFTARAVDGGIRVWRVK